MLTIPLHPYQEDDVDRMCERGQLLLAYEMGTGKTIMAIAAIEELFGRGEAASALIVVPAALRWQWASAIARVTDTGARRVKLKKTLITVPEERYCRVLDGTRTDWVALALDRPDYLICSYDFMARNVTAIRDLKPDIVVCDEAQMIKSAGAARTKAAYKLNPYFRYALTGTPMDNGRPEEVYSLMKWVDASVLGRWDLFDKAYVERFAHGGVKEYKHLDVLNKVLKKAMARKTTEDPEVAACMPTVEYRTVPVRLDAETRQLYDSIAGDLADKLQKLAEAGGSRSTDIAALYSSGDQAVDPALGEAMAARTALRMMLCHPDLLRESAWRFQAKAKRTDPGSAYCNQLAQEGVLAHPWKAPKLNALTRLLRELLEQDPGAKALVFTSYATMLPILSKELAPYSPEMYDGSMTAPARSAAVARVTTDPACRLLLATDAGGTGLDLPVAKHVVNYDAPAGLGRYQQRCARHRRASSPHKTVYVHDLQVADTVDEHDYAVLRASSSASAAAVDGRGGEVSSRPSLRKHLVTMQ